MKQRHYLILGVLAVCLCSCSGKPAEESMEELTKRVFTLAEQQYTAMDSRLADNTLPQTIGPDSTFRASSIGWWCSGFYPGSLWYIYEYTHNEAIKELAVKNTLKLDSLQYIKADHDIGFQLNCSYGNGYRLTGNEAYLKVLDRGAHILADRFNPATGVTLSWDFRRDGWQYPVIIDNMMNLELLMFVADACGNDTLRQVACSHADTTMKNHFRDDYTAYHLVDYDPEDGHVRGRQTVQGYADESDWSRGQAWALYGYTMMYRMAREPRYLEQALHIADMLVPRLPEDGIPYWDFDAPDGDKYRDASAGAIMASALVELSGYAPDEATKQHYLQTAEKQLRSLASPRYLAAAGENCNFLLKHSVGNIPGGTEIDVPLSYADYYFLEALMRLRSHR